MIQTGDHIELNQKKKERGIQRNDYFKASDRTAHCYAIYPSYNQCDV